MSDSDVKDGERARLLDDSRRRRLRKSPQSDSKRNVKRIQVARDAFSKIL